MTKKTQSMDLSPLVRVLDKQLSALKEDYDKGVALAHAAYVKLTARVRPPSLGLNFPMVPYPGGKGRLAPILVSLMPQQGRLYREPFAGRGNVFWAAASSLKYDRWELNDPYTAPFFRAVRDIGDTIAVPERSKEEYYRQWEQSKQGNPVAALLEPYLTFGGGGYGKGGPGGQQSAGPDGYTKTMRDCHTLLRSTGAQLSALDWSEMDWSSLGLEDFVFFDPPYKDASVRPYDSKGIDYPALVRLLKDGQFRWMLTEYPDNLYLRELGRPFYSQEMQNIAPNLRPEGGGGGQKSIECVWLNYRPS